MDEASYLRLIRGEARGPLMRAARSGLALATVPYGLAVRVRNASYDRGGKAVHRAGAGVPVVSVGNLTVGGTGKTPMVEFVARRFRGLGLRVAILSRGYGGSEGLNDEGRVLEENLPDVPHLQGPDRVALSKIAVEELESEVLVLDDGFQHRRLARDLDMVLLDALDPFGLGHLLPRGLLREPISSLRRADLVVLSRADLVAPERRQEIRVRAERAAGSIRWAEARHAPRDLIDNEGNAEPIDRVRAGPVVAFCGIGNPDGFRRTLEGLGAELLDFRAFRDHHPYDRQDVDDLIRWARDRSPALALTTQKDSVKLQIAHLGPVPLRAVRIGLELTDGVEQVEAALDRIASMVR